MGIKSLPENERPLEKLLDNGAFQLSNAEIIGLIINTGTKGKSALGIAEEVLALCGGGLSDLPELDYEDLVKISGIGPSKAGKLLAAIELCKRISTATVQRRPSAENPNDVADLFMERLRYEKKEHFNAVLINSKGQVIGIDKVSIGELSSTVVHPREAFNNAVKKSAAAIIFVHNHPSGDPSPSPEDLSTTHRLMSVGKILGIRVLDHIIIGNGVFTSLKAIGEMEDSC